MENITLRVIDSMAAELAFDMQPDIEALEALDAAEKELTTVCPSCCLNSGRFFMEPWNCPNC